MRRCPALVLLLVACGSREGIPAGLSKARIDSLPGGVIQVTNTGPSAWADTLGWKLVEERVIAPQEGTPGEIGDPGDLAAGADGTVYLLQTKPVGIQVYGANGQWVRTIGRDGDGPGEFRNGMFTLVGDRLVVQDPNAQRLTVFRTSGEFVGTYPSQCCWWTSQFPAFADSTVGILGPPPPAFKERQGALYVTRLDGTVVDTVLLPVRPPDAESQKGTWTITRKMEGGTSMMSLLIPLQQQDASAFLPTHRKVTGNTGTYRLAITNLKGDTLRIFSAPSPVLKITDQKRDSLFEETVEGAGEQWREGIRAMAKKSDIPTQWPAWSDVMVDAASRIWVARPGARGKLSLLDVFTPEGVLLGTVPVPHEGIMQGYWTTDHVYLRDEDENGQAIIRVFRLVVKP